MQAEQDNSSEQLSQQLPVKYIDQYVLDPLSVIVKLAILSKKIIGSKITIGSNVIYIQEAGIFQGLVRFVYKVRKDEIQFLYNPIEVASKNFLCKDMIKKYPRLKNLFTNAIDGLKNLVETYKQDVIFTHALFMYESLINNYLESLDNNAIYNPKLFKNDSVSIYYTKDLINDFSNVWTDDRITLVLNLFEFINKDSGYEKSIKCLEDLMNIIDNEIQEKVTQKNKQPNLSIEQTTQNKQLSVSNEPNNTTESNKQSETNKQLSVSIETNNTSETNKQSETINTSDQTTQSDQIEQKDNQQATNQEIMCETTALLPNSQPNIQENKISDTITKVSKSEHKKKKDKNNFFNAEFDNA
jgi:hypothetical protein